MLNTSVVVTVTKRIKPIGGVRKTFRPSLVTWHENQTPNGRTNPQKQIKKLTYGADLTKPS